MINKNIILILVGILIAVNICFSQDTLDIATQQKLENLAESSQNEEQDYTSLVEALEYYRKNPINLNNTNAAQLTELGLLDEIQIENLLEHIEKNGKLLSIYELQSIDGFAIPTIEKILPYIKLSEPVEAHKTTLKDILKQGTHEFILRGQQVLEEQKGFSKIDSVGINDNPNSRYIGSPQKIYARYRFTYKNNVSAGITAEKDPGELFFIQNNKYDYPHYDSLLGTKQKDGFDFYSAHLFIRNVKFIKALAIGDYQVGFGQGLTSWSGLAYSKSSDAENISRIGAGLRPYTSSDENRFMRGAGLTMGGKSLQATAFFSRKKVDANIASTDSGQYITSLQETGLHTTPSEISDKDAVTQTLYGGNISYRKRKYSFGITGTNTSLSSELIPVTSNYNQFTFSGKQLTNLGADYSFLIRNFHFFGEVAVSSPPFKGGAEGGGLAVIPPYKEGQGGLAVLNGCQVDLDPKVSLSILHRSFQKNYQNLSANPFAESSNATNEQGLYFGITAKPTNHLSINAYYDHFNFPWLKYQVNAPSDGNDFLVQVNYTIKKLDTYVRVKQKDKFVNSSSLDPDAAIGTGDIDFITPYKQLNYRWNIAYRIHPSIKLSNRIEYLQIKKETGDENGHLIYQDFTYKKYGKKLSLTLRYALFDTKSYDSRIYAYENEIPGTYSIPSYYNKGSRVYLLLNYSITHNIDLWLRYSQTYYSNQSVISAGTLNEIDGHTKSEVKVQMRMRF